MKLHKSILAVALCFALVASGCTANWVNVAIADLPIAINLALQVAQMADPASQKDIQEYGQEAAVDLQLVKTLVDEYNKANKTTKQTDVAKITQVLNEVSVHLNQILSAVHVVNSGKAQHIIEAVNLALLTVTTINALINGKKVAMALPGPEQLQAALVDLQTGN